jgi:GPN-loop GTPase
VKYKEVMKQYGLGPNGGIVTSLNLFSTKFQQVVSLLDQRSSQYELAIIDTPGLCVLYLSCKSNSVFSGQIEVFTWSASGTIITETLASTFPTVILYVMDTVRSSNPVTFMSNMLYACSILYKTKLPFIIALNKVMTLEINHRKFHKGLFLD